MNLFKIRIFFLILNMNKNLNKFFENDFENVNWMDLFKNPKYFNQDAEVEKPKYVPKPWEVKRNYQI